MKNILLLFLALFLPALLTGCSEIHVTTPKWTCEKYKQTCHVAFSVINKSDESVNAVILIRAYDRTGRSITIMGEKVIKMILSPNEQFAVNERLIVNGPVSMVVATTINDTNLNHTEKR